MSEGLFGSLTDSRVRVLLQGPQQGHNDSGSRAPFPQGARGLTAYLRFPVAQGPSQRCYRVRTAWFHGPQGLRSRPAHPGLRVREDRGQSESGGSSHHARPRR